MKDIEDIIRNSGEMDGFEPSEGHFDRFEEKLEERFQKERRIMLKPFLRIAVLVVLIIMSGLWVYDQLFEQQTGTATMALSDLSPEYAEVEYYFTSNINSSLDELEQFKNFDEQTIQLIEEQELTSMDSVYNQLMEELAASPNDERIIEAMIMHYQTKLMVINKILSQLKNIKQSNTSKNENIKSL